MYFNDEWQFALLGVDSTLADAQAAAFQPVDIPHDWLIGQDDLYQPGDGWYRRVLRLKDGLQGTYLLCFDGVYMDCTVFLNGQALCVHRYGYTPFQVVLNPALQPGDNVLHVQVRHRSPSSRWYSGAGIFRDVTLQVFPGKYLVPGGVYVHAVPVAGIRGPWQVDISAEIEGFSHAGVVFTLLDPDGQLVEKRATDSDPGTHSLRMAIPHPRLWGPGHPDLYTLSITVDGVENRIRFGLRTVEFRPDSGFWLNGRQVKLHGVCLHHDLGALGAAFHPAAFRRQAMLMQAMGANAIRFAHNPPAAKALDICDELGIMAIDEAFDMWERPKTPFDYARFFPDNWRQDIAAMVRRDRCHPSVIMWSIGNEIYDTHASPRGVELTQLLRDEVRRHDPLGNAGITLGSNYMPWEGAQHCADVLKLAGYNYGEKYYAAHHAAHPDWVLYGSETASTLASRGVYHFPISTPILSAEDLQCSALGNSTTSWGTKDMRRCLMEDLNTPYTMGQFLWAGVDYIGEPTPYHTRSCYFGMADTAGFPKDVYYQVQAAWTARPMVHIGVSWEGNPGQLMDVPVYTNAPACELFLNGQSLGRKAVNRRVPEESRPLWHLPYTPGELVAVAYDLLGRERARDVRYSYGDSARLVLSADRQTLQADGEDMAFLTVSAVDADGHPVENANDRVQVRVTGPVRLMGLDNGDSTDEDGYQVDCRRLFSGKLLVMVGVMDAPGIATVTVTAPGLMSDARTLVVTPAPWVAGRSRSFVPLVKPGRQVDAPAVRAIRLMAQGDTRLTPEHPTVHIAVTALPERAAAEEIYFRVVNAAGIDSTAATVTPWEGDVLVTGHGDGLCCLRAACHNGSRHMRVLSQLEIRVEGFGQACLDPYGFIAGGLYDLHDGDIGPGNDQGIAFARDGYSMAGFTQVDFGPVGSDEITLPIFALDSGRYHIGLWLGDPREGGRLVATLPYQKPSRWNTYTPETYRLPERLTGVQTLCFTLEKKIHLKGFSFTRQSRAWLPLDAADADEIYGDSFRLDGTAVRDIGNNVSLVFRHMDFGSEKRAMLTLTGSTPLDVNTVQLRMAAEDGRELTQQCPFTRGTGSQRFHVDVLPGECTVTFVFLPGCQFDLEGFQFTQEEG